MDHPAIAKVYDAGTTPQGHPFFAMEWIDGPPLNAFWASRGGDLRELLELFIRICMGAQHAHQRGVIHRDLKPSNVLIADVDGKPSPKIIDFGIAIGASQTTGGESTLMQTAGTRGYMSPEQLRGKISEIDVRTDIYALGVMLLELLLPASDDGSGDQRRPRQPRAAFGAARIRSAKTPRTRRRISCAALSGIPAGTALGDRARDRSGSHQALRIRAGDSPTICAAISIAIRCARCRPRTRTGCVASRRAIADRSWPRA